MTRQTQDQCIWGNFELRTLNFEWRKRLRRIFVSRGTWNSGAHEVPRREPGTWNVGARRSHAPRTRNPMNPEPGVSNVEPWNRGTLNQKRQYKTRTDTARRAVPVLSDRPFERATRPRGYARRVSNEAAGPLAAAGARPRKRTRIDDPYLCGTVRVVAPDAAPAARVARLADPAPRRLSSSANGFECSGFSVQRTPK